ncbi:porin [Salinimonas iocasae]|uniref:Porin n=1 Tax=Salinimonas iocasae TaxID=2572577 RepID=A0A5B7YEI1_9ALTE|nr:porin [Salinimonas iocasae]QCZ93988.1 porin [Salinimonas iocasae]
MARRFSLYLLPLCSVLSTFPSHAELLNTDWVKIPGKNQSGILFGGDDQFASMQLNIRGQFRYSSRFPDVPREPDDFQGAEKDKFNVNRARLKAKGHVGKPWLTYSWEYELADEFLLDYQFRFEKYDALKFKAGQWKLEYSRERSISSGGQQMLERSLINRVFTIDRHKAVSVYGQFNKGTHADINYWAGIASGQGRGNDISGPGRPLYFARVQWNPTGNGVGFVASDLKGHEDLAISVAYSWADYESLFSRFSSSGGGQVKRWPTTEGQINDVSQFNLDSALMYKGFSWQGEYHEKEVQAAGQPTLELDGFYAQGGYFVHRALSWWPKDVEMAARFAAYESQIDFNTHTNRERAVAVNWFLDGHNNKITADITKYDLSSDEYPDYDDTRFRLQWDVTF